MQEEERLSAFRRATPDRYLRRRYQPLQQVIAWRGGLYVVNLENLQAPMMLTPARHGHPLHFRRGLLFDGYRRPRELDHLPVIVLRRGRRRFEVRGKSVVSQS